MADPPADAGDCKATEASGCKAWVAKKVGPHRSIIITAVAMIVSLAFATSKILVARNAERLSAEEAFDGAAAVVRTSLVTGWESASKYPQASCPPSQPRNNRACNRTPSTFAHVFALSLQMVSNLFMTTRGDVSRASFGKFVDPAVYFSAPFIGAIEWNPMVLDADRELYELEGRFGT